MIFYHNNQSIFHIEKPFPQFVDEIKTIRRIKPDRKIRCIIHSL